MFMRNNMNKLGMMVAVAQMMTPSSPISDKQIPPTPKAGVTPPLGTENILPAKSLGGATDAGIKGLQQSKPTSK
jgi:hypothetical protein